MQYDVYGIGNALLDIQYDIQPEFLLKHNIPKGLMTYVEHSDQERYMDDLGRSNRRLSFLRWLWLQQHDSNVSLRSKKRSSLCRIGKDVTGDQYYDDMKAAGLHCNFDSMPRAEGFTGRCLVKNTPDADRTMLTYLGTSIELCEQQLNLEALKFQVPLCRRLLDHFANWITSCQNCDQAS